MPTLGFQIGAAIKAIRASTQTSQTQSVREGTGDWLSYVVLLQREAAPFKL